jgi:hypothetical protein
MGPLVFCTAQRRRIITPKIRSRVPLSIVLAGLGTISSAAQQQPPTANSTAAQKEGKGKTEAKAVKNDHVRRLQPADFPLLPQAFVEKLNTRGCTIPQYDSGEAASDADAEPNNVIHGEFVRHGQEDWAVLCSKGATSTIVIFWEKPTACPASLARLDDAHYLKLGKDKTLHYSRSIRALGEANLDKRSGLSTLRPLPHQGIDDRFVGKSSSFFYCNEGKWRIFPAKDSPASSSAQAGASVANQDSPVARAGSPTIPAGLPAAQAGQDR